MIFWRDFTSLYILNIGSVDSTTILSSEHSLLYEDKTKCFLRGIGLGLGWMYSDMRITMITKEGNITKFSTNEVLWN